MKKIKNLIIKNLGGRRIFLLFVCTNVIYACMLVITIPDLISVSGGMKPLDMMPMGYDLDYVNSLFHVLGSQGREIYLYYQIPLDMVYPLFFGVTYCLLIAFLLQKINLFHSRLVYVCLLPIIVMIADYAENIGIILMLNSFPNISMNIVYVTSVFTIIKSVAVILVMIAVLLLGIYLGIKSIKNK